MEKMKISVAVLKIVNNFFGGLATQITFAIWS